MTDQSTTRRQPGSHPVIGAGWTLGLVMETALQRLELRVQSPGDDPLGWVVSGALPGSVPVLACQWARSGAAWVQDPACASTRGHLTTVTLY